MHVILRDLRQKSPLPTILFHTSRVTQNGQVTYDYRYLKVPCRKLQTTTSFTFSAVDQQRKTAGKIINYLCMDE